MKPIHGAGDAAALALERFLPFRLSVLSNRLTRAVSRAYAQRFHLSAPEWRTMAVLGRYGTMSANSVVERTAMDKVRVSRAVARLLATNRVTRRTDPEDRRRAILDLTAEGRSIYAQIVPLVLAIESELLGALNDEERAALDGAVAKLEARTANRFARAAAEVED